MNLFELFVKVGVDDQASGKLSDLSSKLGNGLKTAAKIGTAAVGAAAAGITALTTAAVNNYAEYEQLVGGIETLFEDLSWDVGQNAANAFKTAGLSANEYMETAMSFAASLNQSLTRIDGNIARSAEMTDQAIIDMADNANKMGTSMEMIQNAYQGFAKQNYSMLDNLKLGYGGTASEMYRLLQRAAELDEEFAKTANFSIDSKGHLEAEFADITQAIHIIQTEMGITGTTALEAGRTISGSVGAMKSAWTNLITGLADGNADIGQLVDNLVTTIVGDGTESNLGVLGNIMPAVKTALNGASKLVKSLLPKIVKEIPKIINDNLPILAEAAISIIQSLVDGISENQEMLMETAFETITYLANSIITMLPQIVQLGLDLIISLANGIATSLPVLIPTIVDVILQIVNTLTDPKQLKTLLTAALTLVLELTKGIVNALPKLVDAAIELVNSLIDFILDEENLNSIINAALEIILVVSEGLVKAIPELVDAATKIIEKLCEFFLDPENILMLWDMALKIVVAIVSGLGRAVPELVKGVGKLIGKVIETFESTDWGQIGKNIVDGLKNGLLKAWNGFVSWFKGKLSGLVDTAKDVLGIASPSKVFKKIGGFTAEGFGVGFDDEFARVKNDIEKAMSFDDVSVDFNASVKKPTNNGGVNGCGGTGITIVQNIYSEAKSAADLMQEAIYQQERAVFLGV